MRSIDVKLVAITGGIGSGKSVVASVVQVMGYQVYDCDQQARRLMTDDPVVRQQLVESFGPGVYREGGSIDRQYLSGVAFSDDESLSRLNGIVHPATINDMSRWAKEQSAAGAKIAFVETALLRTAGMERLMDSVWHVTAPSQVRIGRVMERSGLTAQQVVARMEAQAAEETVMHGEEVVVNDDVTAVLPQVIRLINKLLTENKQ